MIESLRHTPLALILACGLAVFANSLDNSFHYDDGHSLRDNPHIRSLANIPRFFVDPGTFSAMPEARMYRPLLLTTYALNYALGGEAVWGYHLVNLSLHLANAWMVWLLACRLLGQGPGAWLACLVFLLHPVVAEPVNYISSRSALLAALGYLLGMGWVMRGVEAGARSRHLWGVGLCYAAALSSKEIAFTLPLLAALYVWLWSPRLSALPTGPAGRPWRLLAPPVALSALYLLGTRAIVGKAMLTPVRPLDSQWATQVKAMIYYLWTAVAPVRLSVEPQFSAADGWWNGSVLLAGALLLSAAAVALWRGNRLALFCTAWFWATLLPAALVPLNVLVNENRLYLPLVGAALGLGALLPRCGAALRRGWPLLLVILALLSIQRNTIWQDEETLWADAVDKGPRMPRAHVNLGKALLEAGHYERAIQASRRALEIEPQLERAHYNIGTAYLHLGRFEEAIASYRRALEIQPGLVEAHNNLGNAYLEQGRAGEAIRAYREALAIQPHSSLHHNLGKAFLQQGQVDSAAAAFRRALELDPENQESHKGLAKAYRARPQEALGALQEALRRWPEEPVFWVLLGDTYLALGQEAEARRAYSRAGQGEADLPLRLGDEARRQGDWSRARAYYEQALREKSPSARVYNALGECLTGEGREAEALDAFRRAAQLDPGLGAAYANIGRIYLKKGGSPEAVAALERAVELAPDQGSFWALLGGAYLRSGKGEQAIRAYQQAVEKSAEDAESCHTLGRLFQQQGRPAEAERLYRLALERRPGMARALYDLGNLFLEQGRFGEAEETYRLALAQQPDYEEAHINRASALLKLGRGSEALEAYERFLKLHEAEDELKQKVRRQVEALRQAIH